MEQRYDAVTMVMREGFSITDIAAKFNVSRQTVYRWLAKYEAGGLEALADESHRPHHVPHQMIGVLEVRVLDMRRRHPLWGPKRIQFELKKAGVDPPPSHMAIYRALVRSGLVVKGERKKVLRTYKRWERGRPMELWQMDVVGSIFTLDGTEAKILTGIDDHSRFRSERRCCAPTSAGSGADRWSSGRWTWSARSSPSTAPKRRSSRALMITVASWSVTA